MGCAAPAEKRTDNAAQTARTAHLQRMEIGAAPFVLTGWERITQPQPGSPVHIYIEGDGFAWASRTRPSSNPTPKNPTGLHLASADPGPNVLYLARPCQYTPVDRPGNTACSQRDYWLGKRFSAEVIQSYMSALDTIAQRTGTSEFHITGYSGGANIAGILAARRSDITQLRTVAGNVDNDYFTRFHNVSVMPDSLNMAHDAATLASIPQMHFIGADDKTVPPDIFKSYALRTHASMCVKHHILPGITHDDGWKENWPSLLAMPVNCD